MGWVCTALAAVQGHCTAGILVDHLLLAPNIVSLPMIQAAECGVEIFDVRIEDGYNNKSPFARMGCPVHNTH